MADRVGRVQGKVALITGAASGLGAESARRLAREGASVMLTDKVVEPCEALAEAIAGAGGQAAFCRLDVTNEADWIHGVEATLARFGRIDVLLNNAGVAPGGHELMTHTLEAWRGILAVNLDGVFLGMRHGGPAIARGGGGSVINMSSVMGRVGAPAAAAYCASKGGVMMLTKAAAMEWAPLNIRVNCIQPGVIDTPMVTDVIASSADPEATRAALTAVHALGRMGVPREIADGVLFLASDESSFMTGTELVIDGGYTAH